MTIVCVYVCNFSLPSQIVIYSTLFLYFALCIFLCNSTSLRSFDGSRYRQSLFLLITSSYSFVRIYHKLFQHAPLNGHLDWFQSFALTHRDSAALNSFYIHVFMYLLVYLWDRILEAVLQYIILLASAKFLSLGVVLILRYHQQCMRVPVSQQIHQQS